ncbi:MAG: class I SAM-dependent methyltransferase [Proteobacteria bacterium]|nr:class I SAM-dependent methyltransferase [Pseudomonadota bacterium]
MTEPAWLEQILDTTLPAEGGQIAVRGVSLVRQNRILRARSLVSDDQGQTGRSFGFKWHQRDTFESEAALARTRTWLRERYGDIANAPWWSEYGGHPLVLDAGCGAGLSSLELFGERLARVRYLGVDISDAVDVARTRFEERGIEAAFLQADLTELPLRERSVDVVFSEGVLHHTDSTRQALTSLARLLAPNGRFLFYVYRKKGPIREFADDYIRDKLRDMTPQDAWQALKPLTEFGAMLGDLDLDIDVPTAIDILDIPAGKLPLQRFFYWHIFKAFYRPEMSFDELHHINFDWYAPSNAHRQTPEEVRAWCRDAGLVVDHEVVEEAGITVIARRVEKP